MSNDKLHRDLPSTSQTPLQARLLSCLKVTDDILFKPQVAGRKVTISKNKITNVDIVKSNGKVQHISECIDNVWPGSNQSKTLGASLERREKKTFASSLPFPDCGRNKTCLRTEFPHHAMKQALASDSKFWNYILQENHYDYNITDYTRADCQTHGKILVVYIHTHPQHHKQRTFARETWGNITHLRGMHIMRVFGVGIPSKPSIQLALLEEARLHHDMILGSFIDTYRNLTWKNHMGLRWLYEKCPQSDYVLKMDDDYLPNIYRLVDLILDILPWVNGEELICAELRIGQRAHRGFASKKEYALDRYPHEYCPGRAYLVHTALAMRMSCGWMMCGQLASLEEYLVQSF